MMSSKVILTFLKLGTTISYCCIITGGEHIGGPIGIFLLFGLFSMQFLSTVISVLLIVIICSFIWSAFNPRKKADLVLFLSGGIAFLLPLLFEHLRYPAFHVYMWTLWVFIVLWIVTMVAIDRINYQSE